MKSISFAKALTLGCLMTLALPIACGDDDDDNGGAAGKGGSAGSSAGEKSSAGDNTGNTSSGGDGGAAPAMPIPGTSETSITKECGGSAGGAGGAAAGDCTSTKTKLPNLFIDPCCTTVGDTCGVDSGFLKLLDPTFPQVCLPKAQPAVEDVDGVCEDSTGSVLPYNGIDVHVKGFKACCRAATGTCGVVVDDIDTMELGVFTSPGLGCVDSAPFTGKPGASCDGSSSGGAGGAGGAGTGGAASAGESAGGTAPVL
jgi:hypothetical protein